jgi:Uma2 family endonuclease
MERGQEHRTLPGEAVHIRRYTPSLIIEVLSPSTEAYDRGARFDHYRSIESLQTYVLIAQDRAQIELFQRQDTGHWLLSVVKGLAARVSLVTIGCELALVDVYERVLEPQGERGDGLTAQPQ